MTYLNNALASGVKNMTNNISLNGAFLLRLGKRELRIQRDRRQRYYYTNPVMECCAGVEAGHVEILFFRYWLVVFSKAQGQLGESSYCYG